MIESKLYTMPEVCEILQHDRHTIYKLIKDGKLKAIQTSEKAHWRVFGKHLLEYMEGKNES